MNYYKSGNFIVGIDYDDCAENPRDWGVDEFDWHLVCAKHLRYDLPHEFNESLSYDELVKSSDYDVVPLSFFDHSGVSLMQGARNGWDVCPCGYAWRKRGGYDSDLQGVLDTWNLWANGEVKTATLYDLNGNVIDNIGGLYNDNETDALNYVIDNFFDAPGFDVDSVEIVTPTYTMSF